VGVRALDRRIRASARRVMAERRRDLVVMAIVDLGRHEHREHDAYDGPHDCGADECDRSKIADEELDEPGDDEARDATGDCADGRRDTAANLACREFLRSMWHRLHTSLLPAPLGGKPRGAAARCFTAPAGWQETGMSSPRDDVLCEVFTYVVVLHAGDGRATLPITVCARPDEAEHAARVIAYLELVVLGLRGDDRL
jgi:hypothetical protein